MPLADPRSIARHYHQTQERIVGLLSDSGVDWRAPVPACPGWSVRDVVAHVAAVAQDCVDGTLTGPPTDAETAAQVRRFADHDLDGIFSAWAAAAKGLDVMADTTGVAPPLGDVTCHEHDVRAAIGRPGARDSDAVWLSSNQLLTILATPVPLHVIVEDAVYRSGPDEAGEIRLRTTRFDVLRWRTGRRSRAQLEAMDWSADPTPVLDHLYLFGPARGDLVE